MRLKLITIKYNTETGSFEAGALEAFQEKKEIVDYHPHFFEADGIPCLGVLISYKEKNAGVRKNEKTKTPEKQKTLPKDELDQKETELFKQMKSLRKKKAAELGLPSYILGTNAEMIQVIRRRCRTIQSLKAIRGFGEKKTESIGRDFLELVKTFYPEADSNHAG